VYHSKFLVGKHNAASGGREAKIISHSTNCDNETGCDPYENASAAAVHQNLRYKIQTCDHGMTFTELSISPNILLFQLKTFLRFDANLLNQP
jgi:hypothetical protein